MLPNIPLLHRYPARKLPMKRQDEKMKKLKNSTFSPTTNLQRKKHASDTIAPKTVAPKARNKLILTYFPPTAPISLLLGQLLPKPYVKL
jgi:hypothetical protein